MSEQPSDNDAERKQVRERMQDMPAETAWGTATRPAVARETRRTTKARSNATL